MEYTKLQPIKSFGGADKKYNGSCLLSQSQHMVANGDVTIVSMLLNRNLRALNSEGEFKSDVSELGFFDEEFEMAAGMSFYKDDQLLVADNNANKILSFNLKDFSFVGLPLSEHVFDKPNCVRADENNNIYVGEVGGQSRKFRCFDSNLQEKFSITQANGSDILGVSYVSFDKQNRRILLTDSDANAVHVYTAEGTFQFSISDPGNGEGQLTYPSGTAVDSKGNILICDTGNSRVQVFDKSGKFISVFGNGDTFASPMDVYVSSNGDIFVVDGSVFSGWSRVQVFQY